MPDVFDDQLDFMKAGDQTIETHNKAQKFLYENLIDEEYGEFYLAVENEPLANQIKEACDIIVVTVGWLYSVGIRPWFVWRLVHNNNMMKVKHPPIKDKQGKIIKSPEAIAGKASMMKKIQEEIDG